MSNFNAALEKSLQSLYDYSSNFQVSVELIQKLAQQLKLETFIDNLGFPLQEPSNTTTGKLTIAASSILLDIDFENDSKIVNLSLSINGSENIQSTEGRCFTITPPNETNVSQVKLNCNYNNVTFLNKREGSSKTQVEEILLRNLHGVKLGNFPLNLQYLATIDKYANFNPDLFIYIESIALLLTTINQIEGKVSDNWEIEQGFKSSVGAVKLNINDKLGVRLDFWKDYRYINHEYSIMKSTDELLVGQEYNIQLKVVDSTSDQIDYLIDNQVQEWNLINGKYRFEFENTLKPLIVEGENFSAWAIQLDLNHPVYLPRYILEYFGIDNYTTSNEQEDVFEKLNNGDEFEQTLNLDATNVSFQLVNDTSSNGFINLKSLTINKLVEIAHIIPVLRNFLVFSNIIRTILNSTFAQVPIFNNKRRRSSRLLNIPTSERELTEDVKQKLKESLKLPDDVTDEEILGLSAISETANYSTIQPVNNKEEIDLNSFLQDDNNNNTNDVDDNGQDEGDVTSKFSSESGENYFLIRLEEIDMNSNGDLNLSFESNLGSEELLIRFKISNGEIKQAQTKTDDMEIDNDEDTSSSKFIKSLNLTEDIISSYRAVY
ncbi:hypothetical protein SBY92_001405 [Candida maltosa Xu316]